MTHPDAEVLAEFRAGLVTGRRGARISAHLAGCEHCTGLCGQLAEIPILLAAVPAPAMPDAVARRLEGVLAAETAKTDDSERAADPRPRDRTASPPRRRHRDFRSVTLRVLAPAAAAAIVLAAGGYGLSRIGGSSTSPQAAGSGSTTSSAATATAAPSAGVAGPANGANGASGAAARTGAGPEDETLLGLRVVTSRINYQRATLGPQLAGELRRVARNAAGAEVLASASVQGCVARVTHHTRPGNVKLVEKASFQSQPAIVIVALSGHHDDAWVTNADCDYVLATTTVPGTSTP
jgi:hypothetical protein